MTDLGTIVKQQRMAVLLTLRELASASGISSSHLGRIERGERFPSAYVLRRIAKPLGFEETELLTLAGYLSPRPPTIAEKGPDYRPERVDPYVASVLAQEPVQVQRTVIGILTILSNLTKGMRKEQ